MNYAVIVNTKRSEIGSRIPQDWNETAHGPELNPSVGSSCGEVDAAQKIHRSIAYMKENLDKPLQVSALASSVNISQSHYFALFKRVTGATPIDYFIHLRMKQACQLLNNTSASVKGVAATLGYDDPFYFSRVFRSVHGVAPREYRMMNSGSEIATPDFGGTQSRLEIPATHLGLTGNNRIPRN